MGRLLPSRQQVATWLRRLGITVACLMLLFGAFDYALRFFPIVTPLDAALVAAIPVLCPMAIGAIVLLVMLRRRRMALFGSVATVLLLSTQQAPLISAHRQTYVGRPLTVMTSNLLFGEADAAALVRTVRQYRIEVLATEELTPAEVQRLRAAGIGRLLPYARLAPGPTATGTGLWSRYPLDPLAQDLPRLTFHDVGGRLRIPGRPLGTGPVILAVHPTAPWPTSTAAWSRDLTTLGTWLAARQDDVVVAGDFNATRDHAQFRSLLRVGSGYRDASTEAGSPTLRTFPARPYDIPLIGIDHILLRGSAHAHAAMTITVPGSDHRALLVRLTLTDAGDQARPQSDVNQIDALHFRTQRARSTTVAENDPQP